MSDAFEQAWGLVKMPLDPNSVKRRGKSKTWDAEFIDPDTGERSPMTGQLRNSSAFGRPGPSKVAIQMLGGGHEDWEAPKHIRTHGGHGVKEGEKFSYPSRHDGPNRRKSASLPPIGWNDPRGVSYLDAFVDFIGGPRHGGGFVADEASVAPKLQNKGRGKAMYDLAARIVAAEDDNNKIMPHWIQTEAAERFWESEKDNLREGRFWPRDAVRL